ncbi:hypothetical protein CP532_5719 [Ophiocordyceps camponoti-leonardi (nom. inval.)]|nr:hypothetical protein CP532_5719 [Ophiocordyceps camponoti-leonardi (nom. inval.)]
MRHTALLALSGLFALGSGQSLSIILDENLETRPVDQRGLVRSELELLYLSVPREMERVDPENVTITDSSWHYVSDQPFDEEKIFASSSSFLRGTIDAWSQHQHLVLRPDEVWFEVLAQLNFYMSANAEKVRDIFVNHAGKKNIVVDSAEDGEGVEHILKQFVQKMQAFIKTDWLADWVMPGFSTSTATDNLTASALMMGLMKSYFDFYDCPECGIPSVTLLGTKEDWVALLGKLEHLDKFGEEPSQYAAKLRPIFNGFVESWNDPTSMETKDFWSKIVDGSLLRVCGRDVMVSGWITGFYHWDIYGKAVKNGLKGVELGGVQYYERDIHALPFSYAKVPIKRASSPLDRIRHLVAGSPLDRTRHLVAGNIGIRRTMKPDGKAAAQPLSGWYIYEASEDRHRSYSYPRLYEMSAIENRIKADLEAAEASSSTPES